MWHVTHVYYFANQHLWDIETLIQFRFFNVAIAYKNHQLCQALKMVYVNYLSRSNCAYIIINTNV